MQKYGIQLEVYDPYMRHKSHNEKVLKQAKEKPFDSCTSISVLNVIDEADAGLNTSNYAGLSLNSAAKFFLKFGPGMEQAFQGKHQGGFRTTKALKHILVKSLLYWDTKMFFLIKKIKL